MGMAHIRLSRDLPAHMRTRFGYGPGWARPQYLPEDGTAMSVWIVTPNDIHGIQGIWGTPLLGTAPSGECESWSWEQTRPCWVEALIDTYVNWIWGQVEQASLQHTLAQVRARTRCRPSQSWTATPASSHEE